MAARHKWLLAFEPEVVGQLARLPSRDRMAVFRSLAELLRADNPKAVPNVRKVVLSEDIWRQRQGDFRILFRLEPGKVTHLDCDYVGILHLLAVLRRDKAYE
jgi:mRNA-degrading endonuclease RelE of RelBE toxin-antitoxin system